MGGPIYFDVLLIWSSFMNYVFNGILHVFFFTVSVCYLVLNLTKLETYHGDEVRFILWF